MRRAMLCLPFVLAACTPAPWAPPTMSRVRNDIDVLTNSYHCQFATIRETLTRLHQTVDEAAAHHVATREVLDDLVLTALHRARRRGAHSCFHYGIFQDALIRRMDLHNPAPLTQIPSPDTTGWRAALTGP